ncbi:tRNA lysidine(34) synthetase TilS [Clostridium chromiireducens]|uniref:tRNA(Ile)-lysidine synthase n=1 Tax=Clostridium chromiireducens TaxID=225345 RepID=A0A1V4IYL1_9CLOT|nr:tRNA lysidine(34) synthetase TilS [Clostridium chromiireducens]OPJ64989.1 tRNA(Ile)-lysidine synthase [Clostridium chromiireducens]RII32045.1 tRNA lysidine(34) synthetase TilS [Clostridium chromiireducens]
MYTKVLSYIRDNNLIKPGDKVLIALSGGPDSVCLLNILFQLKEELEIEIAAAHLNHLLRGDDSYKDEEYVTNICREMGIRYFIKRVDINEYSKEYKVSSEMAGRSVRYDFFDEILKKEGFNKIATAHNANDQAETILFRIMRGTGLEGIVGIKAFRDEKIIRPILCLGREEIEKYIESKNLKPRIDKTNFERIYNRNKIRLDILPYMKANFNEDIVQTLNRMSVLLKKDNEFLEKLSLDLYNKYCVEYDDYFIIKREIFREEEAVLNRTLRHAITKYSKSNYDFEMKHIYMIIDLAKKESGKVSELPNQIYVENIYGDIYIKRKKEKLNTINIKEEINLNKNNAHNNTIEFRNYYIKFSVMNNHKENSINLNESNLIKYFDFDKVNGIISVRNRKNGDKIVPLGMNGSKKLKDIFIDMKISKDERDTIPILCFDERVAWIIGVRNSEEYKVTAQSKNILKVVVERKEY